MFAIIDTGQLYFCVKKAFGKDATLDYEKYLNGLSEGIAYVIHQSNAFSFVNYLQNLGLQVQTKQPRTLKVGTETIRNTNFNVEMAVSALTGPEELLIGSSDIHLLPLFHALKRQGKDFLIYASGIPTVIKKSFPCREIDEDVLRISSTT